jgi:hypothetical protein
VDGQGQPVKSETKMVKIVFQALAGSRTGMHGKPGRLVDDDRLAVYEENPVIP